MESPAASPWVRSRLKFSLFGIIIGIIAWALSTLLLVDSISNSGRTRALGWVVVAGLPVIIAFSVVLRVRVIAALKTVAQSHPAQLQITSASFQKRNAFAGDARDADLTCLVTASDKPEFAPQATVRLISTAKHYPADVIARGENPLYCYPLARVPGYPLALVRTASSQWWITRIS